VNGVGCGDGDVRGNPRKQQQGIGQRVDYSIADSHLVPTGAMWVRSRSSSPAADGAGVRANRSVLTGVYPCADGWVEFSAASTRMDRFAQHGQPGWLQDEVD
jgi:crotonobetainyl-CoA:carnitine CoA-transferase CaiB-like acyl-CoA transferase